MTSSAKRPQGITPSSSDTIVFNVGGQHFEVFRHVIESRQGTLLANLLDDIGFTDDGKPIYVDANPDRFLYILDWYRYGDMYVPDFAVDAVLRDASFYQLPDVVRINGEMHTTGCQLALEVRNSIKEKVWQAWPNFEKYISDMISDLAKHLETFCAASQTITNIPDFWSKGTEPTHLYKDVPLAMYHADRRQWVWLDEQNVCNPYRCVILLTELRLRGFDCSVECPPPNNHPNPYGPPIPKPRQSAARGIHAHAWLTMPLFIGFLRVWLVGLASLAASSHEDDDALLCKATGEAAGCRETTGDSLEDLEAESAEVVAMRVELLQQRVARPTAGTQRPQSVQTLQERRGALLEEFAATELELASQITEDRTPHALRQQKGQSDDCTDSDASCSHWASIGECERNPLWMTDNCAKSCDKCSHSEECKDEQEHCNWWAQANQCELNKEYMSDHCKKSCNLCPAPTPAPGPPCEDDNAGCAGWAAVGECDANPDYMHHYCKKSCGKCSGGGETTPAPTVATPPPTLPTGKPCRDKYGSADCEAWAAAGECERNTGWMNLNCAKACKRCTNSGPISGEVGELPDMHGMAYAPSPLLTVGTLPNDDFMMDGAAPLWNTSGRDDFGVLKELGVNVVRMYGNDPQWNHRNFFDAAHKHGIGVIAGMSDWPYMQMNDPPNCVTTGHLCYDQLYSSYKANLETGGFLVEDGSYHPALTAVIIMNEPELKIGNTGPDTIDSPENLGKRCKLLASAWDAMLQVEQDLGVSGRLVHFTITWAFAQFIHPVKIPGLGQMEYFYECVTFPDRYGYTPKNDLHAAFLTRWVNGVNTQNWASSFKGIFMDQYAKSYFWNDGMKIPFFVGEYHSLDNEAADVEADLREMESYKHIYPFFKGYAFFEFSKRYDKGPGWGLRQDEFGMFAFGEREILEFDYFGTNYSVMCLKPRLAINGQTMMSAFVSIYGPNGGNTLTHKSVCLDGREVFASQPVASPVAFLADAAPCLCVFDVDRTLTGKQWDVASCGRNKITNCWDTAYSRGRLTLSAVGDDLSKTFCAKQQCYVGIVTAGDASGYQSCERQRLVQQLQAGGRLVSTEWSGPSAYGGWRRSCKGVEVSSTLVTGCVDATKQFGVQAITTWLSSSQGVQISPENVWMFDDRSSNIEPFRGTGMNARQISCASRDKDHGGAIGRCGAAPSEIDNQTGVHLCQ